MSMFDDSFDRDGDGHLDFDEEAERDYWYFDRDEENNSRDDDTYVRSGNSGHFYSSSGTGYRKAASGGSTGRTADKQKTDEELIAEYAQKVAEKAERKSARREKIKNSKKKILTVSGIIAVLIAACVVIIIFSVINRQNRYVEEVAGYYVGTHTTGTNGTKEEYISKTMIITDRKNISFDGRQWKVTKIRKNGANIYIRSLDGSFYTCELVFIQGSNGRAYIMTVNYDEECGGSFYHYYTESEYKFELKKLK